MQRYFVAREQMLDHKVRIVGDDVKHITRVMRMKTGDEIICSNGQGRSVRCEIVEMSEDEVQAEIVSELPPRAELPVQITIAQGLPKGDKLDFIVQKGTELGASRFIPFSAVRSVVKWDDRKSAKKIERLKKIAKEAAEQSHREMIPTIETAFSFVQLKRLFSDFDAVAVAYEEVAKQGEETNLTKVFSTLSKGQTILVIIGPEGGFTETEAQELVEAGGVLCGFGPRILRTETASLYALAAASYHFELTR